MTTPLAIRIRRLLWTPVRLEAYRQVWTWHRAVRRGPQVQARLLERLLALVAGSDFARDHGLQRVRTLDDLRRAMPVAGYERAAPYVERLQHGRTEALFAPGTRVHMFAMTSGTTGTPKLIPVTDPLLRAYRQGWHVWGVYALEDHYDAFGAKLLQLTSRMDERTTPSGIPAGAMSGLTARAQRRVIRWLYVMPPETSYAADTRTKYYLACRLGLLHPRIMPITANPSTLLGLARAMDEHKEDLVRDVADGTLKRDLALDEPHRRLLEARLKPRPGRARQLDDAAARTGRLYPKDAWELPLVGTWKGGTLGLYLRDLPRYWGDAPVRDIGLIASEGRLTVPLRSDGSEGVLETKGTVFELLPEAEADGDDPPTLRPHEAEAGGRYFLVLTTPSGLFRYHLGDLVEVVGWHGPAPVVRFLNKGQHISNLTGEKITEFQAVSAVNACLERLGLAVGNYCLCPTWGEVPGYSLLVEEGEAGPEAAARLASEVDTALARLNIEYEAKRASGRLRPVQVKTIPAGAWQAYDAQAVEAAGGRVEQYKHKFLVGDVDFDRRFAVCGCYGPQGEGTAR